MRPFGHENDPVAGGRRGRAMAEQLWRGQGSAALTTACCRGGGAAAAVARAAAGSSELPMTHRGGKTGGRDGDKEAKRGERNYKDGRLESWKKGGNFTKRPKNCDTK